MNKKIIIEGEKVHHVGYRPFLLAKAWELDIPNYFARNIKENGAERLEVSIGGDEEQVNEIISFINGNYPPEARVSDVREGESPKRIMPIEKYDRVLASEQQSTIVQTGLGMLGKQDQMLGKQDQMLGKQDHMIKMQKQTIEEVKTVGVKVDTVGNKIDNFAKETKQDFKRMDIKYDKVSEKMEAIDNTLKELTKAILALAEKAS